MRSSARITFLIALLGIGAGCDDSTGTNVAAVILTDTVELAAPLAQNDGLPTALDISRSAGGGVIGGRYPERSRDATQWDFAVRLQNGELVLVPARVIGLTNTRSAITPALEGETFESVEEAPVQSAFNPETTVAMRTGSVYGVRSRPTNCGGFTGEFYGKIQPLDVDVTNGRLRLQIVTNGMCEDVRLVEDE